MQESTVFCVWFDLKSGGKAKKKTHDFKHSCLQEDQEAELVDTQECVHLFFFKSFIHYSFFQHIFMIQFLRVKLYISH